VVTLFGLASVLAQLIAPISWAHSYTVALPGFVFVPASLYHDDRPLHRALRVNDARRTDRTPGHRHDRLVRLGVSRVR
jgi:hypothetical protein